MKTDPQANLVTIVSSYWHFTMIVLILNATIGYSIFCRYEKSNKMAKRE